MILKQVGSSKYFNENGTLDNTGFFVYCPEPNLHQFSLDDAFRNYAFNFIIIFSYAEKLNNDAAFEQSLRKVLLDANKRLVFWLDELKPSRIPSAGTLVISTSNRLETFKNFGLGHGSLHADLQILPKDASGGLVSYSNTTNCLVFDSVAKAKFFRLIAYYRHDAFEDRACLFNQFIIPIKNIATAFGRSTTVANNAGGLLFTAQKFGKLAIVPSSPMILSSDTGDRVVSIEYFDQDSFKSNVDLFCTFFPFKDIENKINPRTTYLEYSLKTDALVETNFTNIRGAKFYVDDFTNFLCRVGVQRIGVSSANAAAFPDESNNAKGLRLKQPARATGRPAPRAANKLLIGYSGTEAIATARNGDVRIFFKVTEKKVKAVEKTSSLTTSTGSITSLPFVNASEGFNFYLDGEKTPMFGNRLKSDYEHQDLGVLKADDDAENNILPILPVNGLLARNDLESLKAVDRVFSTYRKTRLVAAGSQNIVKKLTPQGFSKAGDTVSYIKKEDESFGLDRRHSERGFRFDVNLNRSGAAGAVDIDLQLSLSKEDVFFVVNPEVLHRAATGPTPSNSLIDILFKLGDFSVDLSDLLDPGGIANPTNKERIVVFKFGKKSFDEYVSNPSTWSNHGKYDGLNSSSAKAIADYLRELDTTAASNREKYSELNRIRSDAGWNGVVILNVPLKGNNLPSIFEGLAASQDLQKDPLSQKLKLETTLKFQFVAFPINRTRPNGAVVDIVSTSFSGLIDYDLFSKKGAGSDYEKVRDYLLNFAAGENTRFLLSKLLVKFTNSQIVNFESYAFLRLRQLFEDEVGLKEFQLTHSLDPQSDTGAVKIADLVRLRGSYQKNSSGQDEFSFGFQSNFVVNFGGSIVDKIVLDSATFVFVKEANEYRFDLGGSVQFNSDIDEYKSMFSFESLRFENIGFKFKHDTLNKPSLNFDISNLLVFPKINFNGAKGFLSSFPLTFNRFQAYRIQNHQIIGLDFVTFDFNNHELQDGAFFGFVFDFDLGTLGNIEALKALKGEILVGWSRGKGFKLGLKLKPTGKNELHIDLFGALKLDIQRYDLCSFKNAEGNPVYFLRLVNARLTICNLELPPSGKDGKDGYDFNGLIYAAPGQKTAWFLTATKKPKPPPAPPPAPQPKPIPAESLVLGLGQRIGLPVTENAEFRTVEDCITAIMKIFITDLDPCADGGNPAAHFYQADRNWLVASDSIIPEEWRKVLDFRFVFNDPVLYGVHLRLKDFDLGSIDILYKKVADNLGVWSFEYQLPNSLRSQEMGGASVTLPNIGIDIFTNGDWKLDIGFPRGDDWRRSAMIQIRTPIPLVGWAGFYLMKSTRVEETLFWVKGKSTLPGFPAKKYLILQAGLAIRVGVGAYIDKGIFYAGASISVYGILEGSFAFEGESGLKRFFPDHFALMGRVGVIAEIVGYVDFKIIKAAVFVRLSVEVGLLLIMIKGRGLLPAPLYIQGTVSISVVVTICCFKVFGHEICIRIRFSFQATVRFEYTIGGDSSSRSLRAGRAMLWDRTQHQRLGSGRPTTSAISVVAIPINSITHVPIAYIPGVTNGVEGLKFTHNFAVPFFGVSTTRPSKRSQEHAVNFSEGNLVRDIVQKLFQDLTAGLTVNNIEPRYENIRQVLLSGELEGTKVELTFDNYRPWLITELDIAKPSSDGILHDVFKFQPDEIKALRKIPDPCPKNATSGVNDSNCIFRIFPIPIAKNILVGNSLGTATPFANGFSISIKNIADVEIHCDVNEITDYSDPQLEKINAWFDSYKTQFLSRKKQRTKKIAGNRDLRAASIIPEYFKLIGLLTLEAYYGHVMDSLRGKESTEITPGMRNPLIDPGKISSVDAAFGWKFNDSITDLVGQLNYFYNNGLRLPNDPLVQDTTDAYFKTLKQVSDISNVAPNPTYANVEVKISDPTSPWISVDIKNEVFSNQAAVDEFTKTTAPVGRISRQKRVNYQYLKNAFINGECTFTKQFALEPVRLQVQNGKSKVINPDGSESPRRFFPIPDKLSSTDPGGQYRLRLNRNKRSDAANNGPQSITEFASICANVSLKVGCVPTGNKVQIVEISNVFVDDLSRARLILTHATFLRSIATINFYQKAGAEFKQIAYDAAKLPRIVKTNLSNKSHPPVIGVVARRKAAATPDVFIADSSDRVAFTRLLWEALTTNDGGYFLHFDTPFEPITPPSAPTPTAPPTEYFDLVVSFEVKKPIADPTISESFPAFCNYINLSNISDGGGDLFKNLDDNAEYLYLDLLSSNKEKILEYHPQIPAHCAGFELVRNLQVVDATGNPLGDEYSHYLPLEFDLTRKGNVTQFISREKVLPLMPTQVGGQSKLLYKHVTPLVEYDLADFDQVGPNKTPAHKNSNRYGAVGNSFKFEFGLRDTYGFRAISDLGILQTLHEQKYFDKLVPVSSWPLIDFSYWLKDYSAPRGISWDVNARISLRDLVDLMGLADDPSSFDSAGNIQLSALMDSNVEQNLLSVLRNLYTIKAQLAGPGVKATIGSQTVGSLDFLSRVVAKTISMVLDFANTGKFAEESLTFSVTDPTPVILRTLLEPSIQVERKPELCVVPSVEAWDANSVRNTIHKLKASAGRYVVVNCSAAADTHKAQAIVSIWAESNEKKVEFVLVYDKAKLLRPQVTFLPGEPTGAVSVTAVAAGIKIVADVAKPLDAGNVALIKITFDTPMGSSGVVPIDLDKCAIWEINSKSIAVDNAIGGKVSFDTKPRILEPSNPVNLLHSQINQKSNGDLGLGISSNDNGEKVVYLIRQKTLREINFSQTLPLDRKSYFGILPINTKLWSGSYKDSTFANVDLDAALQTVLAKIDSVLSAESVKTNITGHQADISNLITGKKQLVENRLKVLIANVERESPVPSGLIEEFRNLILRRLGDFYNFDGIISLTLDAGTKNAINPAGTPASELNRLTVNIRSTEGYNLISSKIGCDIDRIQNSWRITSSDQWAILFDQITNSGPIQLNGIEAEVSHVEFGIKQATPDSDVEASQWIQLLEPVIVDHKISVDQTWNRIVRRFPPKPVILDHLAQMPGANHALKSWDPREVGKWEYLLQVADVAQFAKDQTGLPIQNYDVGDKIYVKLTLGSIEKLTKSVGGGDFFGFLAYWSSEINRDQASQFDLKSFAKELEDQTQLIVKKSASGPQAPNYYFRFRIEKAANASAIAPARWKAPTILADSTIKAPLSVDFAEASGGHPDDRRPYVAVRGFDVFDEKVKIVSVSCEIWVTRNEDFGNVAFRYTTEHIFSANPATPHLHFTQVLELKTPNTFGDILTKEIPDNVPFKITGKWVLNAGKKEDPTLPVIPVRQMEFAIRPSSDPGLDSAFDDYANGKAAISLVIYNQNESDGLPIFHADLIKKEQ